MAGLFLKRAINMWANYMTFLKKYLENISGATAVEYGLIVAAIALAIVVSVYAFGSDLNSIMELFGDVAEQGAESVDSVDITG